MNAALLKASGCNATELAQFQAISRRKRRTREVGGVLHIECSSCHRFLPQTREHFYFQMEKKIGRPRPHAWCKRCYNQRTGRTPETKRPPVSVIPREIIEAQRGFLALQSFAESPLVGAAA